VTHINPDNLERFFDRFYTADNSRSGKGTRLGLAISKSLMKKMNGDITVSLSGDLLNMNCKFRKL